MTEISNQDSMAKLVQTKKVVTRPKYSYCAHLQHQGFATVVRLCKSQSQDRPFFSIVFSLASSCALFYQKKPPVIRHVSRVIFRYSINLHIFFNQLFDCDDQICDVSRSQNGSLTVRCIIKILIKRHSVAGAVL